MLKVAVTGASGHIGANLVRELITRGYEVVALIRKTSRALDGLDVVRVHGDISDRQSLSSAFKGVDQVYHLAAFISIQSGDNEELELVNIEGTRNVLETCQSEGVSTLIHFSSIDALAFDPLDQAVTEEAPLLGVNSGHGGDYDQSKAQADRLVRQNNCKSLSTRIIYPTAVFGPNDFKMSLFGQAIVKMAHGRLPVLVAGGFDWVDARDVAWGAVEAAEKGIDGDLFILSGHYLGVSGIAMIISELTGIAAPRFSCPLWLAKLFAPMMGVWARIQREPPIYTRESLAALSNNMVMSHLHAAQRLAYKPRPLRQSMRDTLAFYAGQKQKQVISDGD